MKQKLSKDVRDLADRVAELRAEGKTVVMCHGVFDLVHVGHIRHFEEARGFGDVLIVTLTPDRFVNKGAHRPAFPEGLRAEAVAALNVVDHVAINEWPTAVDTIQLVKPSIYCKGSEYRTPQIDVKTNLKPEFDAADRVGAVIRFTDDVTFSSSELLNRHFSSFPPETNVWLDRFRADHTEREIIGYFDLIRELKVLIVGEAIIDEYVHCSALGKSTKDPVLACQYHETEAFAGGSLAIANHLAGFCKEVTLVTYLGAIDRREEFVRGSLAPNVHPIFITKEGSPTIRKTRYVDRYSQAKLLEMYSMNDAALDHQAEGTFLRALDTVDNHDVVIVADYGHGLMGSAAIEMICSCAGFLAVNTQSNAGNRGFNTISKYRRADYVCLAKHEIAIETRLRDAPATDLLVEVSQRIDCDSFTVTAGKSGSLHHTRRNGFTEVPSLAKHVVDRVGAGDAFLALSTLLLSQGAPWEVVGFVGNVAGAQLVAELGNRTPLDRVTTAKHIISLLK